MIDLKNTYVKVCDAESLAAYLVEADKQGYQWLSGDKVSDIAHLYSEVGIVGVGSVFVMVHNAAKYKAVTEITIADLKPRTKTEYVECCNLQTALNEFVSMAGIEFYCGENGIGRVNSVKSLALAYGQSSLYRKVEREYTWKDELEQFAEDKSVVINILSAEGLGVHSSGSMNEKTFIEMCHLVVNATKGE